MSSGENAVYVHPTADVSEKVSIGSGTKIWHQAQVRENVKIGSDCIIGKNVYVDFDVKLGDRVKIQNNVNIYHGVEIEDDVFCGPSMTFTNDMFPRASLWDDGRLVKTLVKKGSSIGANATIVCGITLGANSMVGAGSVVTKDVPDHGLVYGNPARLRGFVCGCGRPLDEKELAESATLYCSECDRDFKFSLDDYRRVVI